jgi:hypothetical protein
VLCSAQQESTKKGNMKRENKAYSYKEQIIELELQEVRLWGAMIEKLDGERLVKCCAPTSYLITVQFLQKVFTPLDFFHILLLQPEFKMD